MEEPGRRGGEGKTGEEENWRGKCGRVRERA